MKTGKISRAIMLALLSGALAACGGGSSHDNAPDPEPDPQPQPQPQPDPQPDPGPDDDNTGADPALECTGTQVTVDDTALYNRVVSGIDILSGPGTVALPFVKKIRNGGRFGDVTLGADNRYVYTFDAAGLTDDFSETADEITYYDRDCVLHSRKVLLYSDPFVPEMWHLRSTGTQTAYNEEGAVSSPGVDLNVRKAWADGVSGRGITVAVIDDDLEENHPDLRDNLSERPTIRLSSNNTAGHGTAVSSLIGAVAGNLEGVRGVAYNARLRGVIGYIPFLGSYMSEAYTKIAEDADIRVINNSWGVTEPYFESSPVRRQLLDDFADSGVVFVKASSNYFANNRGVSKCASRGISCHLPMNVEEDIHPASIITGAVASDGSHASYSDEGSNLLVTAPGGEKFSTGTLGIISADMTSCSLGAAKGTETTAFMNGSLEYDGVYLNPDCDYRNNFSGTSAATPLVSGAAALVLSRDPALTVWQVRYALAGTARKPTENPEVTVKYKGVYVYKGWVENRAGFSFSNRYGFGLVDVSAAVDKAADCRNDERCRIRGQEPVEFISNDDPVCEDISGDVMLSSGYRCVFRNFRANSYDSSKTYDIENITVNIGATAFKPSQDSSVSVTDFCTGASFLEQPSSINNRKALAEVQIDVESPAGTRNIMKPLYANYSGSRDGTPLRLLSNAFMGEDFRSGDTVTVYLYSTCPLANPMAGGSVTVRAFER